MAKCGECTYYRPVSPVSAGAGWCHCDAMQVAVVADLEACKNFERRTSMDEDKDKDVTISLTWYEVLLREQAKLDIVRTLVKHLSKTYNKDLELLKVLLEEEECVTT
ncbi:hypothetical protein [Candidatus Darwinibacter acetoxidans]